MAEKLNTPLKLLHVNSSSRITGSATRHLSAHFLSSLTAAGTKFTIDYLDLAHENIAPLNARAMEGMYLPDEMRSKEMKAALIQSDKLCERVLAADILVFAVPMYNFGMPHTFKIFIDNIVRSGITFSVGPHGVRGHLAGKKVAIILASGGDYRSGASFAGMDCLTPHLQSLLSFMGLKDADYIHAQPLAFMGKDAKVAAIKTAEKKASDLADRWAKTF